MARLATDVGGTFTDLVSYDEVSGEVKIAKTLTTQEDQSIGVMDSIHQACTMEGLDPSAVEFFVHGGTTVINAITERKGVKTALVTTEGFRDVLEIARGNRPDLYNLRTRTPAPFVPRHLRFEIPERMDWQGNVLTPLDEEKLVAIAESCRRLDVKAIAIVFLHSYVNPDHENRCVEVLSELLPDVTVSPSNRISRQWREFERSNTTVLNAYVQPIIRQYFANLSNSLAKENINCTYYAMQSNGGVATFDQATDVPLSLVESGPSGGVAGAVRIGRELGADDLLYFDVGGTTAKCSLIKSGQPKLNPEYKLEWSRRSPGYPVQIPVVDIVEIGSGGGSIAWLDDDNGLHVGPSSAGAMPGPACYKRGGTEPTVTDAKLVLGILDPDSFAKGQMTLDVDAAKQAFEKMAARLNISITEAAAAVVQIAEADMINALKLISVQRGHDPRDLDLVASGGAGPMLAASIGRELSVKSTVIPIYPGIFSAWGMLAAMPRVDLQRTHFESMSPDTMERLKSIFATLITEAVEYFSCGSKDKLDLVYQVDVRYHGQEHSVLTRIDLDWDLGTFLNAFHEAHETAYSFKIDDASVEITNVHLQAQLHTSVVSIAPVSREGRSFERASKGRREVYFSEDGGWHDCDILDRDFLPVGELRDGPALIEEATTTTLVLPGQKFEMTGTGLLKISEK
ncbi:hydantoinase/oxoprolinase family protein [Sneathiella litorea]|uniref:Hydantoinase/oxoprolinase family protein n=1 Tax=Sneathiella litorea TaxID=2606216 RepID=A0A6L8W6L6_9PROT|nr:hydantoinase/oxoprolinase family protein [Sneathiella litorea]MZR29837.1 hydantoinase/oxoprolinase family protein [Sneathiella litorea]